MLFVAILKEWLPVKAITIDHYHKSALTPYSHANAEQLSGLLEVIR